MRSASTNGSSEPRTSIDTALAGFSHGCSVRAVTHVEDRLDAVRRVGRALADPTRGRILLELSKGPGYPSELAEDLGTTRANVSNHLSCLRGCGLVMAIPEGRQVRYQLANPRLAHALDDLLGVVLAVDEDALCLPIDAKEQQVAGA